MREKGTGGASSGFGGRKKDPGEGERMEEDARICQMERREEGGALEKAKIAMNGSAEGRRTKNPE
jgi:hypothetical protein